MDDKAIEEILKIVESGNTAEVKKSPSGDVVVLEVKKHKRAQFKIKHLAYQIGDK